MIFVIIALSMVAGVIVYYVIDYLVLGFNFLYGLVFKHQLFNPDIQYINPPPASVTFLKFWLPIIILTIISFFILRKVFSKKQTTSVVSPPLNQDLSNDHYNDRDLNR